MNKIFLIGAGGHSNTCTDVIEKQKKYQIIGYIEKKSFINQLKKYKVFSEDNILKLKKQSKKILIAVGQISNSTKREKIYESYKSKGFEFIKVFSPFSIISNEAEIKEGSIVMHNVVVNSKVIIGKNCIINTSSLIEHDCAIGNHTHISTGVILNGGVKVGNNCFIGSGTIIKNGVNIGNNCLVGMGLVIKKNIPSNSKIIK